MAERGNQEQLGEFLLANCIVEVMVVFIFVLFLRYVAWASLELLFLQIHIKQELWSMFSYLDYRVIETMTL